MNMDDDPLDPDVLAALEALAAHPARDPEKEAHGLENLLAAARFVRYSSSQATIPRQRRFAVLPRSPMVPGVHTWPQRLGLKALAIFAIVIVALFGAGGATTLAARGSLPGDGLYAVKTALEEVRITLSTDASQNAELHMRFARRRLDEISRLVGRERYENLEYTAEQFRYHLREATHSLRRAAESDPTRAQELALAITDLLAENSAVLTSLHAVAPEVSAPAIDQALVTLQLSAEDKAIFDINPILPPTSTPTAPVETPLSAGATSAQETPLPPTPAPTNEALAAPTETPVETPTLPPVGVFDLDVKGFKVSSQVTVDQGKPVEIQLDVKNNGPVEGEGTATVTGVQGGVQVYNQSMPVTGGVGKGRSRYFFPGFIPASSGEIVWTVSLSDGDPDVDEGVAVTTVSGESDPGGGESGKLDLDIHNIKFPANIKLQKARAIEFLLGIKNNGLVDGQGSVTVTGVQNGAEVYSQTWPVTDAVGGGHSRYSFAGYVPGAAGEIVWTITLSDDDPDDDTAMAVTQVEP